MRDFNFLEKYANAKSRNVYFLGKIFSHTALVPVRENNFLKKSESRKKGDINKYDEERREKQNEADEERRGLKKETTTKMRKEGRGV